MYVHPYDEPLGHYASRVRLNWFRQGISPIDGYRIYRSADDKESFQQIAEVAGTKYVDETDLNSGYKYYYRVRPFTHAAGNGASLGTASAVTNLPPTWGEIICDEDGSLYASASVDDTVTIAYFEFEWKPADQSDALMQREFVSAEYVGGADLFPVANYTIEDLSPLSAYTVRITAHGLAKSSEPFTTTVYPLASPQIVGLSEVDGRTMRIQWQNRSPLATQVRLQWSLAENESWAFSKLAPADGGSALVRNLRHHKRYVFQITALAGETESQPSGTDFIDRA